MSFRPPRSPRGLFRARQPVRALVERLRRLGGFAAVPLVGAVIPLLAIPAITATAGGAGWAAVAVGLSVGAAGAVLIELAWGLTGPQLVARTDAANRPRVYLLACYAKVLVFCVVAPVGALIASHLSVGHRATSVVACLGGLSVALSPGWFFLGLGTPSRILLTESLPRVLAVAATSVGLLLGCPLWISPMGNLVAGLVAPVLGWRFVEGRRSPRAGIRLGEVLTAANDQRMAMGGRALTALYIALPTALLSMVDPSAVAQFSAVERLMRMSLAVVQSVPNAFQRWVGSALGCGEQRRRITSAVRINLAVGVVCSAGFALLGPWAGALVFSGTIHTPRHLAALAGAVILCTTVSRAVGGLGLVRLGRLRWIVASAAAACAVGAPLLMTLGSAHGAPGALSALVLAELVALAVQAVGLVKGLRREEDGCAGAPTGHGAVLRRRPAMAG